jgi:hypothetical protein
MTRNQFYLTWTIIGLVIYYGLHKIITLLVELITTIEIALNVNPNVLMYSQTIWYSIIIIGGIVLVIRIIKAKSTPMTEFNSKNLRPWLVGFAMIGIVSQIATKYIRDHRLDGLLPYLDKHDLSASDYYSQFLWLPSIPNIVLFISAIIIFYILTKKAS